MYKHLKKKEAALTYRHVKYVRYGWTCTSIAATHGKKAFHSSHELVVRKGRENKI